MAASSNDQWRPLEVIRGKEGEEAQYGCTIEETGQRGARTSQLTNIDSATCLLIPVSGPGQEAQERERIRYAAPGGRVSGSRLR